MLKKTITYTDYNNVERTEDFYFNLTKAELAELDISANGGYAERVQRIVDAKDNKLIFDEFKAIITLSYGVRSEDGRYFDKDPVLTSRFLQSEAYSELIMELFSKEGASAAFVNGIVPAGLSEQARAAQQQNQQQAGVPQDRLPAQNAQPTPQAAPPVPPSPPVQQPNVVQNPSTPPAQPTGGPYYPN